MPNQNQNQNFYPNQRRVTNHKKMKNGRIDGAGGSMIIAYWADVCLVVKRTLGVKKTAFNLLVATGYLKLRESSKVHYDFIPYPS